MGGAEAVVSHSLLPESLHTSAHLPRIKMSFLNVYWQKAAGQSYLLLAVAEPPCELVVKTAGSLR